MIITLIYVCNDDNTLGTYVVSNPRIIIFWKS